MDSTQVARYQLADAYLRAGQFDRAISLLEDLYAGSPENYAFYGKLKEAYENLKRYDDAIDLVNEKLRSDRNSVFLSDLARLYYLQDQESDAFATWDEAIKVNPDDPNSYRIVYQSLVEVRQFERAIAILEKGREATGKDDLFQTDLAYLYNLTGKHDLAMQEYLDLLRVNERQFGFVRSRLSRFIEQEEALRSSIAVTSRAVRSDPLNRAFRELLGWLYVEIGSYENAFDAYRAIDRLERENGQILFQFAQMAADAGAFEVASKVYQEILDRYPDAPSAAQAEAGLGEMHQRWAEKLGERAVDEQGRRLPAPKYEKALETYKAFLKKYPANALYPEVLRRIGALQQDVFYDLAGAESTLQQVVSSYPNSRAADIAEFDLARAALMRGELDEARLRFSRLEERQRTGELAEMARYRLAEIHFFLGEFDAAQSIVDIIDVNTSTDVSNDAIELKILLMENRGPDSLNTPLQRYAEAVLAEEQRHSQQALDTANDLLSTYPSHALADDVRFLRARVLKRMGRSREAYDAFAELPLLHPQSYLADKALFAAAEIQELELSDAEAATRLYTRLLSEYPGSLLAAEARDRIRRLRGSGA